MVLLVLQENTTTYTKVSGRSKVSSTCQDHCSRPWLGNIRTHQLDNIGDTVPVCKFDVVPSIDQSLVALKIKENTSVDNSLSFVCVF